MDLSICEFMSCNPDKPKEPPMCDFTEQRCIFCVFSDAGNYQKALASLVDIPHLKRSVNG